MAMSVRRISFPDAGDLHAAPGSHDWAVAMRLELQAKLHASETDAESLRDYLLAMRKFEGWRELSDARGNAFGSFELFCAAGHPYGLGYDVDALDHIVQERRSAAARAARPKALVDRKQTGRGH